MFNLEQTDQNSLPATNLSQARRNPIPSSRRGRGGSLLTDGIESRVDTNSLPIPSMYSASAAPDASPLVVGETSLVSTG